MDQPSRRCFCSEWDLYCVSTRMRRSPECRQLLRVKSMMRYRPPKGTAGLALSAVNGCRREPIPPARMMLIVFSCMRTFDQGNNKAKIGGLGAGFKRFSGEPGALIYSPAFRHQILIKEDCK